MFTIINKICPPICPESLHDEFAERSLISKYDTKNLTTDLQVPRLNPDFSRKSSEKALITFDPNTHKRV